MHPRRPRSPLALAVPLFLAVALGPLACSSPVANDGGGEAEEAAVTYYQDIRPILEQRCTDCHVEDGAGPYPLDSYADAKTYGQVALGAVEAGVMPPWPPDPSCRHYADERVMPDDEVALLREWVEAGMPEGTPPSDDPAEEQGSTDYGQPDIVAAPSGAYTPREDVTDDYHCFLLDAEFDQDTYMVGSDVMPDNVELVHHADIFLVSPYQVDNVEALEAEDPEAGYPCFGDPGFNSISLLGAWVPGSQPIFLPDGTASVIPKGSRLVLQTHFNTLYTEPAPVRPEFHLYTQPEPPEKRVWAMPFANLNFEVPPGESESVHTTEYTNRSTEAWTIIGAAAHMHLLGSAIKIEVERKEGGDNACLLDIPDWDFDWQQAYRFRDDEWVQVNPGDTVRMTCTFDNSPANQPVIDGVRQEPQTVTWGGKTTDEMCLSFLVAAEPYEPPEAGAGLCDAFIECRDGCEDPFGIKCIFNCATADLNCGQCLLQGAQRCANRYCPDQTQAAYPCLINCAQAAQNGGDIDGCLVAECPEERDALEACLRPRVEGGYCNQDVSGCDVEF